jgi:para-nitrobenzyl esterase
MRAALLLLGATSIPVPASAETAPAAAPVKIASGLLQGQPSGAVMRYLGIPYAAPPAGPLRWQPPQDVAAWSGVRQADRFGAACAQIGGYFGSDDPQTFDRPYGSEDCLTLNVWTPGSGGTARPVLVFIHGGAGVVGTSALPLYEATRLADELGAVIVSINYRLNFFGSIELPAVGGDMPVGLLDQIKALHWVQDNVAAFGGDPANVTVMGHSAGGVSIWSMLRSPLASGLFQKSVILSGIPLTTKPETARAHSEKLLANLLLNDGLIADAGASPAYQQQLGLDGVRDYLYGKRTAEIVEASRDLKPVASEPDKGDDVLNPVPTIVGSVANEASMLLIKRFSHLDAMQLWTLINSGRDDLGALDFFSTWSYLKLKVTVFFANRALHGLVDRSADRLAATGVPVYRYAFEWDHLPSPWKKLFGAYHGIDVPFLFGNFLDDTPNFSRFTWSAETISQREALHRQMIAGLKGFIETGDPGHYPSDIQWQRWDEHHNDSIVD